MCSLNICYKVTKILAYVLLLFAKLGIGESLPVLKVMHVCFIHVFFMPISYSAYLSSHVMNVLQEIV